MISFTWQASHSAIKTVLRVFKGTSRNHNDSMKMHSKKMEYKKQSHLIKNTGLRLELSRSSSKALLSPSSNFNLRMPTSRRLVFPSFPVLFSLGHL